MQDNDTQVGKPFRDFTGTKASIEATSNPVAGMIAYATDNPTAPRGYYNGSTWVWSSLASSAIIPNGVGSPSYSSIQDWENTARSSGRISGGIISSSGSGTVNITEMQGMIFQTDSIVGPIVFFKKSSSVITGITDKSVNWLYISYDSGDLTYHATNDRSTVHEWDMFTVGRCYRDGNSIKVLQTGHNIYNKERRMHDRLILKYGAMDYVSGAILSQPASLKIAVSAGSWYCANYPYTTAGINSSGSGTFQSLYRSGSAIWTESAAIQSLAITQYNRLSDNTLQNIENNNYGVYWVYTDPANDVYVVYGQADYLKLSDAQASSAPSSIPPKMVNWARLVGRLIFQQGGTSFIQVDSAFQQTFQLSSVQNHNDLSGINGGSPYYHLTLNDFNYVNGRVATKRGWIGV